MSIDFNELLPTFIEESLENVEEIEEALLTLNLTDIHPEDINQIFRSVHTIKGNSTIFKFATINELSKTLENLLDNIRKKNLKMEQQHLNLFLKSNDCLRSMLLDIKKGAKAENEYAKTLITSLIEANKNTHQCLKADTQAEAPALEKAAVEKVSLCSAMTSIRVATEKIDSLMNTVEELVVTESIFKQITKELGSKMLRKFSDNLEDLEKHSRRLQETILRMRMVPIAFAINRFPRMVLELSERLGKEIEFKILGEKTEIDKTIVEKITDPLMHLIRNAIDHGIESPVEREKNKKKKAGVIELSSYQLGNNIIIDIKDDGAGLQAEKIREVAVKKKIISENKILTEQECYQLIFQPGFSTAEAVTDISGRGVGLDVVMKNIHDLGGKVEVISLKTSGTIFRLRLPLTLAIMDCQLIKVSLGFYAIPLSMIIEMRQLDSSQIVLSEDKKESYILREEMFKLIHMDSILFPEKEKLESSQKFLIKVKSGETFFCLSCDDILFQQQIVIKSIEENYNKVPGILGATVLGDGELALILDLKEIESMTCDYSSMAQKIPTSSSVPVKALNVQENLNKEDANQISAEYLCFLIENIEYAFNMKDVKEVCVSQKYAMLPFSPAYIRGIINLRGKIIPVIDSSLLFELSSQKNKFNHVIIIIQLSNNQENTCVGVMVDSITKMNTVRYSDIEPQPKIENLKIAACVQGALDIKGEKVSLLSSNFFVGCSEQKWSFL